jgi:hypothetical protein
MWGLTILSPDFATMIGIAQNIGHIIDKESMKKFIAGLIAAMCLSSCLVYADPVYAPAYYYGTVTICDDYGCREVPDVRYFIGSDGVTYYYDVHFGVWIGPRGYWHGGAFYHGYYPGYHTYYHHGWYGGHGGYYHGGGGYHGGGHHGGHR